MSDPGPLPFLAVGLTIILKKSTLWKQLLSGLESGWLTFPVFEFHSAL